MNESGQGSLWRSATLIALLAAVASLAVAVIALNKKPAAPPSSAPVAAIRVEEQALKAEVSALHALVAKGDATIAKLTTCIPELTGQINGLSVETGNVTLGERTFLTNAYMRYGKSVSSYCQATLESKG
jgi:hypothetical protein